MRAVFDTVMLSLMFYPDAKLPKPVSRPQARIRQLVESLDEQRGKILIPTPALAEFLVKAGNDGSAYLSELNNSSVFEVVPFDERAAIECARQVASAREGGRKKTDFDGSWQKIKVDYQIVAIAVVNMADLIYSDDRDVQALSNRVDMAVRGIEDLPEPVEEAVPLPLDPATSTTATLTSTEPPPPSSQSPDDEQE